MLTTMTDEDWTIVLQVFAALRSRRNDKGRDDRKFLEALLGSFTPDRDRDSRHPGSAGSGHKAVK
jgi:hypothetical protein